jgi:hypothetical protein
MPAFGKLQFPIPPCSCHLYDFEFYVGYGNQTKFDVKIRRKERLLRKSVVSYIGTASEFTGKILRYLNTLGTDLNCRRTGDHTCSFTRYNYAQE